MNTIIVTELVIEPPELTHIFILKVPPETCSKCYYPFIPTHNNKECLLCTRGIDRIVLEKKILANGLIY